MCTAIRFRTRDHYFGRTLDYDHSFGEELTLIPRNFPLPLRHLPCLARHHAIVGMARVEEGFPLCFDGMNDRGLAMAALNFAGFSHYGPPRDTKDNVAHFELIPWILGTCASVSQARDKLRNLNITDDAFSAALPPAGLHWLLADEQECLTLEATAAGLRIHPNPIGVLTNAPEFDDQLLQLSNFMHLSPLPPENRFARQLRLRPYSRGMGALGLPGDLSSQSRFARAAFFHLNARSGDSEGESVSRFFHTLNTVEQPQGGCRLENGRCERTIYTVCLNTTRGLCYYSTYESRCLRAVDIHRENLDGSGLVRWPLERQERVHWVN